MNAPFALDNRMTVVLFAGLGGGCDGLEAAGFPVHVAINHDPVAVAVHKERHPHTRHLTCDVFEADPREVCKGRGVRVLHASPDCTHFSVAKGGKPVSKRRRSLAWVVCRWAGTVRPEVITLENVYEIQSWGPLVAKRDKATGRAMRLDGSVAAKGERIPVDQQWLIPDPRHKGRIWKAWLEHLRGLGYSFEGRVLVCADYGVPTIRKRFFGVAKADGSPIVWRSRTHAPRKDAKRLGLKPWVGVHTCINWSLPVKSIFGRPKDLADATLRRTARGLVRHVLTSENPYIASIKCAEDSLVAPHVGVMRNSREPTYAATDPAHAFTAGGANHALVAATVVRTDQHSAADRNGVHDMMEPINTLHTSSSMAVVGAQLAPFTMGVGGRAAQSEARTLEEPAGSQTAKEDRVIVAATMVQSGYGEREGQAPRVQDIKEPAGTQVAGGSKAALVAAFMAQHSAGSHPGQPSRDALDPVSTLTLAGSQQGVVAASLLALRGTNKSGRDARDPAATIMAGGNHAGLILAFLQHYYSNGKTDDDLHSPLGALTAKARHGLVTVKARGCDYVMTDVGMRMFEPEEGAAAHGFKSNVFPEWIVVNGKRRRLTKTDKYHLVGNSVPPEMVQMLAEDNGRRELVLEAAE